MTPLSRKFLGDRIRDLRTERKLSQEDIARALGIHRQSVSLLEKGDRDLTATELDELARFFQVPYEEILGESPKKLKEKKKGAKSELRFEPQKLRNLLLYILEKIGGRPNLGETVLYKQLYFCDFDHYEKTGKSITGLTYRRLQFGPVPQQSQFNSVVEDMLEHEEMRKLSQPYHGKQQIRYVALTEPDVRLFTKEELRTIENVLGRLGHMNAVEIEEYVHGDIPWAATNHKSIIDYQLVHARLAPYTQRSEDIRSGVVEDAQLTDLESALGPVTEDEYQYFASLPHLP
jgi:transcriptional regulator with XRE-family HTH domain